MKPSPRFIKSSKLSSVSLLAAAALAAFPSTGIRAATLFPVATNSSVVAVGFGTAFDGTNYLVGLMSGSNVCSQLVAPSGAPIGPLLTVGGSPDFVLPRAALAFGRTNYLVVWSDASIASGVDLFGQFVSRTGAKVGAAFPLLQSPGTHGFQALSALAFDGTNFLVVWQDGNNKYIYGQLVAQGGTLAGPEFVISSQPYADASGTLHAAAVFGKTNYLAAWVTDDTGGSGGNIYGALITTSASAGSPFLMNQTVANASTPTLGFDGTNFLAVWVWGVDPVTDRNLHGRLVSPAGAFAGGELTLITNDVAMVPSVGFDGKNYLLAWSCNLFQTNHDVHFCFLDRSATLLGPEFSLFPSQGTNAPLYALGPLAFEGANCVITATLGVPPSGKSAPPSGEVFGVSIPASTARPRLAAAGPRVGTQFPLLLTGTPGMNYAIQVATNLFAPNWTSVATNSTTNSTFTFTFTDTAATNRARFYRATKL
jgi:hypothetical protein